MVEQEGGSMSKEVFRVLCGETSCATQMLEIASLEKECVVEVEMTVARNK